MKAVRFITTYCRKKGVMPINEQRIEETQFADNRDNQIAEIWLQAFLTHQTEKETKI